MHQRALEGREMVLGPEHYNTLNSVHHMAFLLHRQQQFTVASGLYQRAHSGYVRALGAQHPRALACYDNYTSMVEETEL
jgi:hypothetical protein